MPKRLLTLPRAALAALSFAIAGALMLGIAFASALVIENRTAAAVGSKLAEARMDWVTIATDGMQISLTGTAPNEAARFRALNLVGSVVDSSRVLDRLEVTPTAAIEAPRFSVEMLRNDDGIQLIGLMPQMPEGSGDAGMSINDLVNAASALTPEDSTPANMLQSAAWPAPPKWHESLAFGIEALGLLKRSKISVAAGEVKVTAIADGAAEKRRLEAELARKKPRDVVLSVEISAPRPVITPFTLRFIKDADGTRFDACSADTERAKAVILAAAANAGIDGPSICTVGLGSPSPRWSEGAVAAIRAVAAMGAGSVTFTDADITLTAGEGVTRDAFDSAFGDLRASLPDVFSLDAVPPSDAQVVQGPAEFSARLTSSGNVDLRGRLVDEAQQEAVAAFARAAFGASKVHVATLLDPEMPDGWPVRVLAGLDSLSLLNEGSLVVRADTVAVQGVTGAQDARARITQILSSRLGQGQSFRVNVTYDEKLDPLAALPTPEECATELAEVMVKRKISFTPGSAEIAPDAAPVIAALAEVLKRCPGIALEIAGHTDSQGSESGNKALSQARAEAVLIALQGRRVDTSNMTAQGYGKSTPIADNGTEEGREANRRIEFNLKSPKGAAAATPENAAAEGATETDPTDDNGAPDVSATDDGPMDDASGDAVDGDAVDGGAVDGGAANNATDGAAEEQGAGPTADAADGQTATDDAVTPPDFSGDTSPSVAPTEMTVRPQTRAASSN